MYTEQITQAMAIGPAVPPQVINNTNKTAGGVDMSLSRRAIFLLEIGAVAAGGSINAQLVEDTQASLATATNLAGSNTSLTGLTTANKQYTFEARAGQMTKRYLGLKITETGSQNVNVCVVPIGMEGIHKPDNANNDASVATQNVVS
jgi:hypothetical protein